MKNLLMMLACLYSGLLCAQAPVNDACVDAKIVESFPYVDTLDATNATNNDGSIELEGCSNMNDGVWYTFTGTGTEVRISLKTDDFDSEIGIYLGDCESLICVGSIDVGLTGDEEAGSINTILGRQYFVNFGYWDSSDGPEGNITVEITAEEMTGPACGGDVPSNALENGAFITENNQDVATDFIVSSNTNGFNLTAIKANLLAVDTITTVSITFYEDNDGLPGNAFGDAITNLVPTSQEIIGENFGFNFIEVLLDLPSAIDFPVDGQDEKYWMQIGAIPSQADTEVGWETTSASVYQSTLAFRNLSEEESVWNLGGAECVFSLIGTCEEIEGCFTPSNYEVSNRGFTTASLDWNSSVVPESYNFELYNAGDDPSSTEPIFSADVPPTQNFVDITDLMAGTSYDAYLSTDCGDGMSDVLQVSFTTKIAPSNDDICDAIELIVDAACSDAPYNNTDATTQENEPAGLCFNSGAVNTVWFTFVAPDNGSVTITTDILPATNDDTEVALYAAPADCNDASTLGEPLACGQDEGELINFNSILSINTLTPGETYYVQVGGFAGTQGTFCINVIRAPDCPPVKGLVVTGISNNEVDLTWDEQAAATAGFVLDFYQAGADPINTEPEVSNTYASDILIASVTDLAPGTEYDAYVSSDCGDKGPSLESSPVTFRTVPETPACGEMILDTGGDSADYQNNENYEYIIEPLDSTSIITVSFTEVNIEEGFDFLRIYDGDDADAAQLSAEESGVLEPGEFATTVPGSKMRVTFSSDAGVIGSGWIGTVSCTGTSSNEELQPSAFNIFPNPASDKLTISGNKEIERVEIIDLQGQRVMVNYPSARVANLNISSLTPGAYLVRTQIDGKVGTKKIVKR